MFYTRYNSLSDFDVNSLYRSDVWSSLSCSERLDALQELENRSAMACGNEPCSVGLEPMDGTAYGYYNSGSIKINQSLVEDGTMNVTYEDGSPHAYTPDDVNAQLMDTVHHENYHAYQDEAIKGKIYHDPEETALWKANDSLYQENNPLYRIQSMERTAFDHGEQQTKDAFSELEARYGPDEGYGSYLDSIQDNDYASAIENASSYYKDDNIQQNMDNQMLDIYEARHPGETDPTSYVRSTDEYSSSSTADFEEFDIGAPSRGTNDWIEPNAEEFMDAMATEPSMDVDAVNVPNKMDSITPIESTGMESPSMNSITPSESAGIENSSMDRTSMNDSMAENQSAIDAISPNNAEGIDTASFMDNIAPEASSVAETAAEGIGQTAGLAM